jgi:ribosomal protein S27AE
MGKKAKTKKAVKPYFQWAVRDHLIEQAQEKGILPSTWKAITDGKVEITKVRKLDDKCSKCKHYKFDFMTKVAPTSGHDLKIIGCEGCEAFITVYLNERTHGNTPLHGYQIAQGMTSYTKVCGRCGKRTVITTEHKTVAQVEEAMKHECR